MTKIRNCYDYLIKSLKQPEEDQADNRFTNNLIARNKSLIKSVTTIT